MGKVRTLSTKGQAKDQLMAVVKDVLGNDDDGKINPGTLLVFSLF